MTEREATIEVSFADDGTDSAFERLCTFCAQVTVSRDYWNIFLEAESREAYGSDIQTFSMFTDQGEPIPFTTALELASLHLLARLERA